MSLEGLLTALAQDPVSNPFAQFGVLGIFLGILLYFSRLLIAREQKRADADHQENIRLNDLILSNQVTYTKALADQQAQIIPAMLAATEAIVSSQVLLATIQRTADIKAAAEELSKRGLAQ